MLTRRLCESPVYICYCSKETKWIRAHCRARTLECTLAHCLFRIWLWLFSHLERRQNNLECKEQSTANEDFPSAACENLVQHFGNRDRNHSRLATRPLSLLRTARCCEDDRDRAKQRACGEWLASNLKGRATCSQPSATWSTAAPPKCTTHSHTANGCTQRAITSTEQLSSFPVHNDVDIEEQRLVALRPRDPIGVAAVGGGGGAGLIAKGAAPVRGINAASLTRHSPVRARGANLRARVNRLMSAMHIDVRLLPARQPFPMPPTPSPPSYLIPSNPTSSCTLGTEERVRGSEWEEREERLRQERRDEMRYGPTYSTHGHRSRFTRTRTRIVLVLYEYSTPYTRIRTLTRRADTRTLTQPRLRVRWLILYCSGADAGTAAEHWARSNYARLAVCPHLISTSCVLPQSLEQQARSARESMPQAYEHPERLDCIPLYRAFSLPVEWSIDWEGDADENWRTVSVGAFSREYRVSRTCRNRKRGRGTWCFAITFVRVAHNRRGRIRESAPRAVGVCAWALEDVIFARGCACASGARNNRALLCARDV